MKEAYRKLDVANQKYADLLDILTKKNEKSIKYDLTKTGLGSQVQEGTEDLLTYSEDESKARMIKGVGKIERNI
eukprot:CAMPEP_0202980024 /NCGR_PEP_ID=MMETSP1396-20130829/86023_1 /ASSEMBLY_ACC=CAM_ASM_000872 /TAXON_ID= /ORGANISM="Pseudokeronopsis sp., Strain Brazil" /LENGTH=73 /DNA_ID=CAMNT_0049719731 /DNA_START=986 /DNA_END=1207 /DNA_ORIENTATION=+